MVVGRQKVVTSPTRYLLIWFSLDPMTPDMLVPVRRQIEDMVKEDRDNVEIDLGTPVGRWRGACP